MDEVAGYPVDAKLTLCTNIGTVMMVLAFGVCWICGEDPLGKPCSGRKEGMSAV